MRKIDEQQQRQALYRDPKGFRGAPCVAALAGLAVSLGHCAATGAPTLIAFEAETFEVDAPREPCIRLIAN